jgi:hypothetical protein
VGDTQQTIPVDNSMPAGYEPASLPHGMSGSPADYRRFTLIEDATDAAIVLASGYRFPRLRMRMDGEGRVTLEQDQT